MKTKETSTQKRALSWWYYLPNGNKIGLCKFYFNIDDAEISNSQIEDIYDKEVLEPKRQEEWQESQVNCKYSKPNQKQFKEFDESLCKAYIDKLSNEDKIKFLNILVCNISTTDIKFNFLLNQISNYK